MRAPRKNLAQVAVQLAQTRSKPGPYFVPPLHHACNYCVSQGLSHKCLYPSAKAAVCVICKARKRPCVCNERRAVLGLEPKEKEALAPKLRASRIGHLDGAEDSADDLTACKCPALVAEPHMLIPHHRKCHHSADRSREVNQAELRRLISPLVSGRRMPRSVRTWMGCRLALPLCKA